MSVDPVNSSAPKKTNIKTNAPKKQDPTDDKMYEGLSLTDFLRHFVPQEAAQQQEVETINDKGKMPFMDPNFPETMPPLATRSERRQLLLKNRKADKKAQKLDKKVAGLMTNPTALLKAIKDPKVKQAARKMLTNNPNINIVEG
jgi:hypothetical protein